MAWDFNNSTQTPIQPHAGKPSIAVLLPHTGMWDAEFVERMWKPLTIQKPNDFCKKHVLLCRVPSLPLARNTLILEALKTDCTFALWIDSDMIPESPEDPNLAIKILHDTLESTGESIATALYTAKQKHGFNWAIWKKGINPEDGREGFVHIQSWSGNWFEVDVAGAGFMLMRRKVLEDMMKLADVSGQPPFHWEIPDSKSEDFNFLTKARDLFGYKTWCFSDVKLSHLGRLAVDADRDEVECPQCNAKFKINRFRVPRV
jgi:hypothetical protein